MTVLIEQLNRMMESGVTTTDASASWDKFDI